MKNVKARIEVDGQTYNAEVKIDETINQEVAFQWYTESNGGKSLDGVGGRPNDRRKK